VIRRLDHVAVLVRDTDEAMGSYCDRLGLAFVSSESLLGLRLRLTYLYLGNAYLQLLEPLDEKSEAARVLATDGEGLHHVCFGVDDVERSCRVLGALGDGEELPSATGRGRLSAFVPGWRPNGVRLECTEFWDSQDLDMNVLPRALG
jgi:methylmalonyl-CoA/ethylmalonyl-CoA epimerase